MFRLTTFDNPYDRNEEFQKWFLWDVNHGYNTVDLEVGEANLANDMTEDEEETAIEAAVDRIMADDLFGIYKRIEITD